MEVPPETEQQAWRPWSNHPIVVTIVVVAGIVTILTYASSFRRNQQHEPDLSPTNLRTSQSPPTTEQTSQEAEISPSSALTASQTLLSPVTFKELTSYIYVESHTAIQQDQFLSRIIGRRVRWSGFVGNVSDMKEEGISVLLASDTDSYGPYAFLNFAQGYREDLEALEQGQKIVASCRFVKVSGNFQLDSCELESVEPKGTAESGRNSR